MREEREWASLGGLELRRLRKGVKALEFIEQKKIFFDKFKCTDPSWWWLLVLFTAGGV
jgi:hypothetical protein